MRREIWVGLAVSLVGVLVLYVFKYNLYLGVGLLGVGVVILIVTMSFERYGEWKKMKEEISEEDLRP